MFFPQEEFLRLCISGPWLIQPVWNGQSKSVGAGARVAFMTPLCTGMHRPSISKHNWLHMLILKFLGATALQMVPIFFILFVHPQVHLLGSDHLSQRFFVFLHHCRYHYTETAVSKATARHWDAEHKNREPDWAPDFTEACWRPAQNLQSSQSRAWRWG